jgi:sporulation protein YlmC with PRC-barrel domain
MQITFTDHLKGRSVIDGEGNLVGTVEEILLDSMSLQVDGLRVKLDRDVGKDLGVKGGVFHPATLDVPRSQITAAGDTVILKTSRASLQRLVDPGEGEGPVLDQTQPDPSSHH